MAFIQVIEFTTTRIDEMRQLVEELRARPQGASPAVKATLCADRDQENRYVNIVEFPSYEEAMKNSESEETTKFAQRMAALCDGPPTFRNLDVRETWED